MLSSTFRVSWKSVCIKMRKLVQWRKKCIFDSMFLRHLHKGFNVSWKQCLNLCSWRWLRPRRNLVKGLILRVWCKRNLIKLSLESRKSLSLCQHCVKSVRIRSYSGPYFPAFGLNTDQNNCEHGHFLRSANKGSDSVRSRLYVSNYLHIFISFDLLVSMRKINILTKTYPYRIVKVLLNYEDQKYDHRVHANIDLLSS